MYISIHTHTYVCVCFNFQCCVYEKPKSSWGHADDLHDTSVISVLNARPVLTLMCAVHTCVLYMVFWSDCVFEFFLALFLAEFNPQLSSLANLWNKSELICVTHSLR